jgi:predicted branched-subunit amino acid permease
MSAYLKQGLKDSVTFGIGFLFLYLPIGILAMTHSFTLAQALVMTLTIFSTPLQFLLLQNTHSLLVLLPVILALNARFLLMSATLAPHFKRIQLKLIMSSLILIVPSVFTACVVRFKKDKTNAFPYFLSLALPIYLLSLICTFVGFVLSDALGSPILYSMMDIVLPLQFTALAAKQWPEYKTIFSYLAGFILAPILISKFGDYNLMLTPLIIGAAVVLVENYFKQEVLAS